MQAVTKPQQNIRALFQAGASRLQAALPRGTDVQRMTNSILQEIYQTPSLAQCEPQSIFQASLQSLYLGLLPGKINGDLSNFVPFRDKKSNTSKAQLIVTYKGLINLASESGFLVFPELVREGDVFEYNAGDGTLLHRPEPGNSGQVIAAYCLIRHKDFGNFPSRPVWRQDLEALKAEFGKNSASAWNTNTEAMFLKTAVRRAVKFLPLHGNKIQQALSIDDSGNNYAVSYTSEVDILDNMDPATGELITREPAQEAA